MAFPDFREARGFDHLKTLQRITEEHVDRLAALGVMVARDIV